MGTARPLQKLETHDQTVRKLKASLRKEHRLRVEAERNAARFHALLIAERVRKIQGKPR